MPVSARGRQASPGDPLTALFFLLLYPLFGIVHICYHLWLKLVANVQWQRNIYSQARHRPNHLLHLWRNGLGWRRAGAVTAAEASEERLLKRGNQVRSFGRLEVIEEGGGGKKVKHRALAPRHLALVLAARPVRTRVLLFRVILAVLQRSLGRKGREGEGSGGREDEEREQVTFAMDSVQTALRCCALTGVQEVSIYDEAGRVKRALSSAGQLEWTLEWPLHQEWQGSAEEEVPSYEEHFSTPRSNSFTSSTTRSFSSAEDSTPSLSTKPSFNNLNDARTLSTAPRLRLSASLHCPFHHGNASAAPSTHADGHSWSSFPPHDGVHDARIKVNLLGPEDAKGALARAASSLAKRKDKPRVVEVKTIDGELHAQGYPSEPELLIIHGGQRRVRTLHGFPPWLVRLCEIYYDRNASPYHSFSSPSFEAAIASFSRSEQRYGK